MPAAPMSVNHPAPAAAIADPSQRADRYVGDRSRPPEGDLVLAWQRLAGDLDTLLCDPLASADFSAAVAAVDDRLLALVLADTDNLLFVAMSSAATGQERYSASHSLRVCAASELAAGVQADGDHGRRRLARMVALTMNVAMCAEQNRMATQPSGLTPAQRDLVHQHAQLGEQMLRGLGVTDPDWLQAVEFHHGAQAAGAAVSAAAADIAHLVQRADVLLAGFSRRQHREVMSSSNASWRVFEQDGQRSDACSAALIKALGIYPPGTLVMLANHEVAVVRRRGMRADQPHVLAVLRPDGMPHLSFKVRDTALSVYRIVGSLPQSGINLRLPIGRLLAHDI